MVTKELRRKKIDLKLVAVGKNLGGKRGLEEQELVHQEVQFGEEAELLLPQNLNLQAQKK